MSKPVTSIRNRLWIWGHPAGAHNGSWNLGHESRITPFEAAHYMGIPSILMIKNLQRPHAPLL